MVLRQCGISLDSNVGAVVVVAVGVELGKEQRFNGKSC